MTTQQTTTPSQIDAESPKIDPYDAAHQYRNTPIEELSFTKRTYDSLKQAAFKTVEDLLTKTTLFLMGVLNLGQRGIVEIDSKLRELGMIRGLLERG
jgi:DNA-directed RNA polymerase alpha subunit